MKKIRKKVSVIEIFEKDDQFWTTSLDIAEKFEKRHDNVIQAIINSECSERFNLLNFKEISYKDKRNRDQPMYG